MHASFACAPAPIDDGDGFLANGLRPFRDVDFTQRLSAAADGKGKGRKDYPPCVRRGGEEVMAKGIGSNKKAAKVTELIKGTEKHFPNPNQQMTVGSESFTIGQLTALMQSYVDHRQSVEDSKAATKAKVETERKQAPSQLETIDAFTTIVRGMFGKSADVLADFGLAPRKRPAPLSAEQKAVAAAKREATRLARGTRGKRQKREIKGNVKAKLVVTPSDAPEPEPSNGHAPSGGTPTRA
jgi:hypothetical protein